MQLRDMMENTANFMKSQISSDDFVNVDTHEKNIITYDPSSIGNLGYKKEQIEGTIKMLDDYSIEIGKQMN